MGANCCNPYMDYVLIGNYRLPLLHLVTSPVFLRGSDWPRVLHTVQQVDLYEVDCKAG